MALRARSLLVVAAVVAVSAGCILDEPKTRELSGPTDGYSPTPAFLKVHVRTEDERVVNLDFDRRDWYVARIADQLDRHQLDFISVLATPRITNEYLVEHVGAPGELAALRYDDMAATPEQRATMDQEYTDLLERLGVVTDVPALGQGEAPRLPSALPSGTAQ